MSSSSSAELLQLVSAAVTPVVMISIAGVLILGISSKQTSMSDRLRALASDARASGVSAERAGNLTQQMLLFRRRLRYEQLAQFQLYLAVICFIGMTLLITLTPRLFTWVASAFVLFVIGVALILTAVIYELLDLSLSGKTLDLEIAEFREASRKS